MAKEKGKEILTAPPMNSSSRSGPFGKPHGCNGNGCASDLDTWPLHHAYRRGERYRLCSSCILLSDRSLYCCCCFFIVTSPSSHYDDGDPLMAPPAPTATCRVCRSAVAHLACLYPADGGGFVCPACTAAEEGRPFTYAPPCGVPLDTRAARVLLLAARTALALLKHEAAAASAAAERMAREAEVARRRAYRAVSVALGLDGQEPPWNLHPRPVVPLQAAGNDRLAAPEQGSGTNIVDAPPPHEDHLAASGEGSQANKEEALLVHHRTMPPLAALSIGTGCATAAAVAPGADSSHTPPWSSWSPPRFGANEVTMAAAESSRANPTPPRTLDLFGVKEMAMAAAEAARASPPPAPRTLQLFPADNKVSASPKPPKMQRTLQLFQDKIPDDDEEM
uniref:Uncharacterized protein n=2 Tax=Setaria viridis TaxID=4556 RepID=A0A4U6U953_SETVI|nr:uncharacterized protein LOC117859328 [Setaria viridis]TKW12340.1 hypothetical protein SEVIR_5G029700v2 [Setaria viridis]